MANAAHNPKLKEAFAKHLAQTKGQVERLNSAFGILGEKPEPKPCKAMMGLVQEGEETIEDGKKEEEGIADLALIMAAQKVEHYEIAAYGGVRCLARQIGEREVETLLAHTLGEEESSDHMLTTIAKPILQDATQTGDGADRNRAKPRCQGQRQPRLVSEVRAAVAALDFLLRILHPPSCKKSSFCVCGCLGRAALAYYGGGNNGDRLNQHARKCAGD